MMKQHDLLHMLEVVSALVTRDHKARYKSTVMGMVWSVATPVLFLLTFYVLFTFIIRMNIPNYASFVFTGIVAWAWLQTSLNEGVTSISNNASLVGHPGFPLPTLPMVSVVSNLINFLFSLPLVLIVVQVESGTLGWTLIFLPLIMMVQAIFQLGLVYFVSAANVTFRDVQFFLPSILQLGYFTTPIFYDLGQIPEPFHSILTWNPMYQIIHAYRTIFAGQVPDWQGPLAVLGVSGLLLILGYRYFRNAAESFMEEI